ncbi:unnamed protein product [Phytomonas sp. Hart1]|nr:unnamed protein product [Phytomonas sp. Hart1]|eukprot:CCW66657.1 unnamed protein product [Phytomonas sp. isolate Hart1]
MDTVSHPPPLDLLRKLQLFRTTLVNFLAWRNFSDVVAGCYVRVLLEMRNEGSRQDNNDHYYIACVRGVQQGPTYSGFAADGSATEVHIVIDLPPCFKSTQNGNVVQLNSISNSPFRQTEYEQWVQMFGASNQTFPSLPQLHFRLGMLEEQKQQSLVSESRRRRRDESPQEASEREARILQRNLELKEEILSTHLSLPCIDELKTRNIEDLQEIEREVLDLISMVRVAINERSKCMVCRNRVCTEVCYPCKHQVLCKDCAAKVHGKCPVPGCIIPVTFIFEPYTS